jgi:N-acetylneuraminate lyase
MYAVIKGILRENGAPDIGSVRAPLFPLQPEDAAIVHECAETIRALIQKYC